MENEDKVKYLFDIFTDRDGNIIKDLDSIL